MMQVDAIVKALRARRAGNGWIACCPAHDDREPSLSIGVGGGGKVLVHCHAGCSQSRVVAALADIAVWSQAPRGDRGASHPVLHHADSAKRTALALSLWRNALPAAGTLVEVYLASRGLCAPVPATLRFHAGLRHPAGGKWPAMVGIVTRGSDGATLGVHRTFLAADGAGKAHVAPTKMMLGPCGGGAVRLGPLSESLLVGEGVETCLAAMLSTGQTAWAALSAGGMRTLGLPDGVRAVTVLADGDPAGEAAARDCSKRWAREGRLVRIARAPMGLDFNDVLVGLNKDGTP